MQVYYTETHDKAQNQALSGLSASITTISMLIPDSSWKNTKLFFTLLTWES